MKSLHTLHQLCVHKPNKLRSPNRSPNLRPLSESFQESSLHTQAQSLDLRSPKSHLFSHTIQRPNSENLQECSRVLTSTLSTNLPQPQVPQKGLPKSEISLRLFFRNHLSHKSPISGSQISKESSLLTHNSETQLWEPPRVFKSPYLNSVHKLPKPSPQTDLQIWDLSETLFQKPSFPHKPNLWISDLQRVISSHTQFRDLTLRTSKSVQESLPQLCSQASTNSGPQNRSPNLKPLSNSFQEPLFTHTQAQSLDLRSHKESSLSTHKLRERGPSLV
jgi:hypothetical protein